MNRHKKILVLSMCILFVFSTSVIPSAASDYCPNGHITGIITVLEYTPNPIIEPTWDYCGYYLYIFQWTCRGAIEEVIDYIDHYYWMTGASHMTCMYCGFERDVK
ncbi:MAG: hypothetical protein IKS28_05020 [Clostridia bacterium]|nr:hypothetical protein [Clostridia bacterium]